MWPFFRMTTAENSERQRPIQPLKNVQQTLALRPPLPLVQYLREFSREFSTYRVEGASAGRYPYVASPVSAAIAAHVFVPIHRDATHEGHFRRRNEANVHIIFHGSHRGTRDTPSLGSEETESKLFRDRASCVADVETSGRGRIPIDSSDNRLNL